MYSKLSSYNKSDNSSDAGNKRRRSHEAKMTLQDQYDIMWKLMEGIWGLYLVYASVCKRTIGKSHTNIEKQELQ